MRINIITKLSALLFCCFLSLTLCRAAAFGQPLVDTEWLTAKLKDESTVILDIRPNRNYVAGHVPGAVSAPYGRGWRKTVNGVIGMLPPEDEIEAFIQSLGVDNNERVVLLPHGNSSTDFAAATRIYWTFKVLGHDQVSILDGGYKAWIAGYGDMETEATLPEPGTFNAEFRPELVTSQSDVRVALDTSVNLVDARPASQYKGETKSRVVKRLGTIPNASNMVHTNFYDAGNALFSSKSDIDQLSVSNATNTDEKTVTFCNTGHWASIAWFALSEIAGQKNVSLYDGSMTEWAADDANPVQ